jgi:hypothetical protein
MVAEMLDSRLLSFARSPGLAWNSMTTLMAMGRPTDRALRLAVAERVGVRMVPGG